MLSSEGNAAALQTVGLAAAGGNCPHMFAIRGNKKKSGKEEEKEEEEGGMRRWRGRGGQMCLQVRRGTSGWRCETTHRVKQHLLQIDMQADSWVLSRQQEHLEKLSFSLLVLVFRAELIFFVFLQEENLCVFTPTEACVPCTVMSLSVLYTFKHPAAVKKRKSVSEEVRCFHQTRLCLHSPSVFSVTPSLTWPTRHYLAWGSELLCHINQAWEALSLSALYLLEKKRESFHKPYSFCLLF